MKVVVCIKQVAYVYHPIAFDRSEGRIDPDKVVFMLNPYDEIAVEEAVRIKEKLSDCDVIIITAGPPQTEQTLRYSCALGADKMVRIDCENLGPWSTAVVLGKAIEAIQCDVLLLGKKAIDENRCQVGSFLAEILDIPQVSGIVRLEVSSETRRAVVERYLGKGNRQVVECTLPALFTVEKGLNEPRYPSLPNRLSAERAEIEVIELSSLGFRLDQELDLTEWMTFSPPRPKPKKLFTPDSSLSASDRMKLIMSGGMADKQTNLLEGRAEDIAKNVVDFLVRERIV